MSRILYLQQNTTTNTENTYFNLINNNFPQVQYKQQDGISVQNGYTYNPALRMQITPCFYQSVSTGLTPNFYPSKISIMKKSDYYDNLKYIGTDSSKIYSDNIDIKFQKKNSSQDSYNDVTGDFQTQNSFFYSVLQNANSLQRKSEKFLGIAWQQFFPYQRLIFQCTFAVSNQQLIQTVNVYYLDLNTILFSGSQIIYADNDYNFIPIYYSFPTDSNRLFATLYHSKSFCNNLDVEQLPSYRVTINFHNFVSESNDRSNEKIVVSNSTVISGVYSPTTTFLNDKLIYNYSEDNKTYYISNIKCNYNQTQTVIVQVNSSSSISSSTVVSVEKNYWAITDAQPTNLNKAITESSNVIAYTDGQQLVSSNNTWYLNDQNSETIVQNVPIISYFSNNQTYNAIQIAYSKYEVENYDNLKKSTTTLHFYSGLQEGTWKKDDNSYQSIFSRCRKDSTSDTTVIPKYLNNIVASTESTVNFYSFENSSDIQQLYFKPNIVQTDLQNFVMYFDYTKISDIYQYLNVPVVIAIQFGVYETSTSSSVHETVHCYQYAFGKTCDYYRYDNNNYCRDLYLLKDESNISFLINDQVGAEGFPTYINSLQKYYINVKKYGQYSDSSLISDNSYGSLISDNSIRKITQYRYSSTSFSPDSSDVEVSWIDLDDTLQTESVDNANVTIIFSDQTSNVKNVYLQVSDNQHNVSSVVSGIMQVYTTAPASTFLKITGTNSNEKYTGVYIDSSDQQFYIDGKVNIQFSASSQLKLFYKITGDIYNEYLTTQQSDGEIQYTVNKLNQYRQFDANDNIITVNLIASHSNQSATKYNKKYFDSDLSNCCIKSSTDTKSVIQTYDNQGILNSDAKKTILVTFRDQAGNISTVSQNIYFNTRLFKTKYKNLRQATSSYDLQLYKSLNNVTTLISRTDSNQASTTRKWNDIFYPSTHGYPTKSDGQIDETAAKKITTYTDDFDPVVMSNGSIVYDDYGRTSTVWTNSKKYPTMVSSYGDLSNKYSGFVYWIIDNQDYGDISLQFEHFYLDTIAYGPPYNQNLGQRPDSLIIYDASQQGCVTETISSTGEKTYQLTDTSKLKQLQVYSGSGVNAMSLLTGTLNATTQGAFTTQKFSTQRICVIFYSDSRNSTDSATNPIASGFKIKAATPIIQYWQNFDVDQNNGLIWIHLSSNISGVTNEGQSISSAKMTYDYYSANVQIDYDQGSVIFDQQPQDSSGNALPIYATYTYYTYDATDCPNCRTFLLDEDDLVDYVDLNLYYLPSGTTPIKTGNVSPIYKNGTFSAYNAGKLNNYFYSDKDRGVVQFNNGVSLTSNEYGLVPRGRIFADYRYHTYERLGNDGYSDFEFNDSMLIAGQTTQYPDYTWGDIKIVNQGDTQLRDGKIIFLARGQVQDNQITSVLDYDRPWDVQQGTAEETYDKVACLIKTTYTWNSYTCTKTQAKNIYSASGVNVFPQAIQSKQVFYGRIVYCLGGGGSTDSYPSTTAGRKTFSSEISGRFIQAD